MKREDAAKAPEVPADIELEHGCMLCGGPLSLRVQGRSAATYCRNCHWISRPHLHHHHGGMHLFHPSRMFA